MIYISVNIYPIITCFISFESKFFCPTRPNYHQIPRGAPILLVGTQILSKNECVMKCLIQASMCTIPLFSLYSFICAPPTIIVFFMFTDIRLIKGALYIAGFIAYQNTILERYLPASFPLALSTRYYLPK